MKSCITVLMLVVLATETKCFGDFYGTVNMTFVGAGDTSGITSPVVNVTSNVYNGGVYAGPYLYSFSDATQVKALSGLMAGFCVDFTDEISSNDNGTFTVENLSTYLGSIKTNQIEALMGYAMQSQNVPYGTNNSKTYTGTVDFANGGPTVSPASTGLSIAIWAVLEEPTTAPYSLSSSTFGVTSSNTYGSIPAGVDIAFANDLLSDLNANETYTSPGTVYALVDAPLQTQAIVFVSPVLAGVPEPCASVGLAGLAFCFTPVGMVALLRRRRQASAPTKPSTTRCFTHAGRSLG